MTKVFHGRTGALVTLLLALALATCEGSDPTPYAWTPGPGLKTRWAGEVDPSRPWPEYPRPQMVREGWKNLNGLWDLSVLPQEEGPPGLYTDLILVPFPVESALSGVAREVTPRDRVWYRRSFSLPFPPEETGEGSDRGRWILHFGGVDWEAEVFLDGRSLGVHRGGYDPFSFDITQHFGEGPEHELVVAVTDPTDQGDQPRGKQVLEPHGIWYTGVTGIWQTVWVEPVPFRYIEGLTVVPDLDAGGVEVLVEVGGGDEAVPFRVSVGQEGDAISTVEGTSGLPVFLPIPHPRLWSPNDPFLYDLEIELFPSEGGRQEAGGTSGAPDRVTSYFGMRSIEVGPGTDGLPRLLLNGAELFHYGLLDQGWWPDGLYTAPTDEALAFDITASKALGFNLIRKHVKVEPARWYYHADREGLLVWQDMPSGNNETPASRRQFADELGRVVNALRNHPSIVMWVPFNEGWGQHDTEAAAGWLKAHDPTRLVNAASGWTDEGGGDVLDVHRYPGPGAPAREAFSRWAPPPRRYPEGQPDFPVVRVPVLGEFGGLGLPIPDHTWLEERNWGYRSFPDLDALNEAYRELLFQLKPLIGEGLAAAVYTQTTDVEIEVNGVLTYDREVVKLSEESVGKNRDLFGPPPVLREVLATSRTSGQLWRVNEDPPEAGWMDEGFDDSSWVEAPGGFGSSGTPGALVRTAWESSDLWLRRSFELDAREVAELREAELYLRIHHDEDAEIFLNGTHIATLEGYSTAYRLEPVDASATDLLTEGLNVLAVHVRQTDGGQFIDVGIVEWIEGSE